MHPSWWGMIIDDIEGDPAQPGLRERDCVVEIGGSSLCELDEAECERIFAEKFCDGAPITVNPYCEVRGILPERPGVDWESLRADLQRFASDYSVSVEQKGGSVVLSGPQPALQTSRTELTKVLDYFFPS